MKKPQPQQPAEIRMGPITLFYAVEPPMPSLKEQARVVGDFMIGITTRLGGFGKDETERWERLKKGDVKGTYIQLSETEALELKEQLVDDFVLSKRLLPPEEQLTSAFRNARAQLWGTEHGLWLTWDEWDKYRQSLFTVKQADLRNALKEVKASSAISSAQDSADHLADTAVGVPGRKPPEARALQDALLETLFVGARIAYPIHDSNPVQLPERIPAWAWYDGLLVTVHNWWNLPESQISNSASSFFGSQYTSNGGPYAKVPDDLRRRT